MGEGNGPSGMYGSIEPLCEAVAEGCAHQAVGGGDFADAVAMFHEEGVSVEFADQGSVDNLHSYFVAQVVEEPDIVIAFEPGYFNSAVGETGECSEEAYEASRHHVAILIPIVEYVAEEENLACGGCDGFEPSDDFPFMRLRVGNVAGAEMKVGDEVGVSAHAYVC